MVTQSRIDCKKEIVQKYGLDAKSSGFVHMWDLHYKHEDGLPFEDELKRRIKTVLPDANQQELYDLILVYFEDAKRRRRFFHRTGQEDYGYEVLERNNGKFKLKLHTYDKEKAKAYWEALRLDEFAVAPDTSDEVPPSRILMIDDHYGTMYYQADTQEQFKEKAVEFIMHKVNDLTYCKPEEHTIKSKLGMTEEEVEAMPEGMAKRAVEKELKWVKDFVEGNYEHLDAWDSLEKIKGIGVNVSVRDIAKVLNFYQGDRYEGKWNIIDLK
jgi:hypothetical protein